MLIETAGHIYDKKKYISNFFNLRVPKTLETPSEKVAKKGNALNVTKLSVIVSTIFQSRQESDDEKKKENTQITSAH